MSLNIDHKLARLTLLRAWSLIEDQDIQPAIIMAELIKTVMSSKDITYKYILVTGYLAKAVEPRIHARALQASSTLKEPYDARSLCHKVIVSFEKK